MNSNSFVHQRQDAVPQASLEDLVKTIKDTVDLRNNPSTPPYNHTLFTSRSSLSRRVLMSSWSFCSFTLHSALWTSRPRSRSRSLSMSREWRWESSSSTRSSFRLLVGNKRERPWLIKGFPTNGTRTLVGNVSRVQGFLNILAIPKKLKLPQSIFIFIKTELKLQLFLNIVNIDEDQK